MMDLRIGDPVPYQPEAAIYAVNEKGSPQNVV